MQDQEIQIRKIQLATMTRSFPMLGVIALLSSTAAMQLLAKANEDCHPAFPAQRGEGKTMNQASCQLWISLLQAVAPPYSLDFSASALGYA